MLALLCVPLLLQVGASPDPAAVSVHCGELLDGIETLPQVGVPGTVLVFGNRSFPVLTAGAPPESLVAAADLGPGRIVAIAHGGYLAAAGVVEGDARGRLVSNALRWCAAATDRPRIGVLGAAPELCARLEPLGFQAVDSVEAADFAKYDALVWHEAGDADPQLLADLDGYVRAGGGLLTAVCPWGWEQIHGRSGRTLRDDLPQNSLLRSFGLVFAAGTLSARDGGGFQAPGPDHKRAHAGPALAALRDGSEQAAASVHLLERALVALPADEKSLMRPLLAAIGEVEELSAPEPGKALDRKRPLDRLRVAAWTRRWQASPSADLPAAPGSDAFPGAVPEGSPRLAAERDFSAGVRGWQPTGLYLAPGDRLHARVAEGEARGWKLRVGCHADTLWGKGAWRRWPAIATEVPLREASAGIESPFGGLVYVEAGAGAADAQIVLDGAVEAPFFDLAEPVDAQEWRRRRSAPGPWTELAGRHLILTVPSATARELDDPAAVLEWWDSVLVSHCRLGGEPLPVRRERFVADVQISAGYMHAGYPIMMHLDVAEARGDRPPPLLDLDTLRQEGNWGCFHELGHNRQKAEWTFTGTGEVTCNLFSLYSMDQVVGIEPWEHPWLEGAKAAAARHIQDGAPFAQWQRQPGVALVLYAQVQREFGWEPFERVLAEYRALPPAQRPRGDAARRDEWMIRLSRSVGRDLGPFFERWGVPVSDEARAETAALEAWMPDFAEFR